MSNFMFVEKFNSNSIIYTKLKVKDFNVFADRKEIVYFRSKIQKFDLDMPFNRSALKN
jgi:hypothetical protein